MTDNRYRREHPEDELTPQEEAHLRGEPTEPEDEEDDVPTGGLFSPEENTFKKRYGDLRRHSQQREAELRKEIDALRKNAPTSQMPKTKEEVQAWVSNYPDLADIMKTIMREEIQASSPKDSEDLRREVAELRSNATKAEAMKILLKAHPDFDEIRNDPKFHEWVKEQPDNIKNSLYRDLDPRAAARSVDLYKIDMGMNKKAPKSQDNRSAATSVGRSGVSTPSEGTAQWSESKVNSLSDKDYTRHEKEIDEAIRSGKFNYDITGGAR